MRPALASILGLCFASAILCAGCHEAESSTRPSVILITLDTTRADALGSYGRVPSPSPNLDALGAESVLYARAYASSSWTLPTHASLFTGLLPSQHGAGGVALGGDTPWHVRPLASEFTTLAEILTARGYRTAAVVGGPALAPELGIAQGFETYDADFSKNADLLNGKRAEYVADQALEQIEAFGSDPYFLFLNFFDPHRPYAPPPGVHAQGLPSKEANAFDGELFERLGTPAVDPGAFPAPLLSKLSASRTRYHAEVSYMDEHFGRMIAAIDARSHGEKPIVVVTADHGESFGEHNFSIHGLHLYEDNVRVPLLIRWPDGRDAGSRIERPVSTHRFFALILRELGIQVPDSADSALLDSVNAPVVTQLSRMEIGIQLLGDTVDRDLRAIYAYPYKLIESSSGTLELFDLEQDPLELHNLADTDSERAQAMQRQLAAITEDRTPLHGDGAAAELKSETQEALRELGYLQ